MSVAAPAPARLARGDRPLRRERRQPGVVAFFALTFAWSWSFFAVAIAIGAEWPDPRALVPWGLGALGPGLAAFALTRREAGKDGARRLLRGTLSFRRIGFRWWAAMLVVAVLPNAATIAVQTAAGGELPGSVTEADLKLVSILGILVFALVAGLVEEPGWRGYALERLGRHRLLAASLLVSVGWSLWHLPYFLIDGTFQSELGFGWQLWWFVLQLLPNGVLLAWVYVRAGHLVAAAVALHGLGNAAGELLPVEGGWRWIALAFLTAVAAIVVLRDRRLLLTARWATVGRLQADTPAAAGAAASG